MDKITVKEFVEKYNDGLSYSSKENFIKSNIESKQYLPYLDKISIAETAIAISSKNEDTGLIHIRSAQRMILHLMLMINSYTNLEVNFSNIFEDYDLLNSNGLIEILLSMNEPKYEIIPVKEVAECNTILTMCANDYVTNKLESHNMLTELAGLITGVLESRLNSFSPIIDNISKELEKLSDEEKQSLIDNFTK